MVSADRLLIFIEGTLRATGPVFGVFNDEQEGKRKDVEVVEAVRQIRLCDFRDDIRVAVVGANGVVVVDVNSHDMHLEYRRVSTDTRPDGSALGQPAPSPFLPRMTSVSGSRGSSCISRWDAAVGSHKLRETIDAQFISFSSLAIVLMDEALVVEMNAQGDSVKWRIWGSYSKLAVCRVNMHLAFALHSSVVEVFPLKIKSCWEKHSSLTMECESSVVFSPPEGQFISPLQFSTRDEFASHGVSTKLGIYKVATIEWHRVTSHSILCVTCQHPHDGGISVALFTLKAIPMVWLPLREQGCAVANLAGRLRNDQSLQLIPAATISLSSISSSPLSIQCVPNLSRSYDTTSIGNKLEFFCLEMDGTICITSYRFDQKIQGNLSKQQPPRLVAPELLRPLQESYGAIARIDVLPIWRSRAPAFGTVTPQAGQLLKARRYRLLLHFLNGMVAKVMVDPLVERVRVEAFLTLGVDPLPLHLATGCATGGEVILFGLSQVRAFAVEHLERGPEISETRVLAVAPIPTEHRHLLEESKRCTVASQDENKVGVAGCDGGDEDGQGVQLFGSKCDEGLGINLSPMGACDCDAKRSVRELKEEYREAKNTPAMNPGNDRTCADACCFSGGGVVGVQAEMPSSCLSGGELRVRDVQTNRVGVCCSTSFPVGEERWWCIPFAGLDSFVAAEEEILVYGARIPGTEPLRLLSAAPAGCCSKFSREGVCCEWSEKTRRITLWAPTLPEDPPLSFQPFSPSSEYHFTQVEAVQLANNNIVVGVMGATTDVEQKKTMLLLYGVDILRDVAAPPSFSLELEICDVISFVLCCTGDLFVLQQHQKLIDHKTRILDSKRDGYHWVEDYTHHKMLCTWEITTMTPLWMEERSGSCKEGENDCQLSQIIFTSSEGALLQYWNVLPFWQRKASAQFWRDDDDVDTVVAVGLYHPAAVLLLLGMGRPQVVGAVLERILELAREVAAGHVHMMGGAELCTVARVLCRNPVSNRLYERPTRTLEDVDAAPDTASACGVDGIVRLTLDEELNQLLRQERGAEDSVSFCGNIPVEVLDQIMEFLPTTRLQGLSTQEQLGLLSVIDAMRLTRLLGVGLDSSASRFFFFHKLYYLQRRLRVREMFVDDIPDSHATFFWALLSDAQPQLLEALFDTRAEKSTLSWVELEASGVPFWLNTLQALRGLAERVGRGQYHSTRDVRECALMYVLAKKTGVLTALCKAEQNTKLHAFFSRNFNDLKNKTAASNNAFAAISKNQVLYGAAFFVLAGEARNAAQVVLQRHGSLSLAFFVLRLASDDDPDDILWFIEQRRQHEGVYGSLDVWEEICLLWRRGHAQEMLPLLLSQRMPLRAGDAVERLALLRCDGRRMPGKKLNRLSELVLLMRIGRVSRAARQQPLLSLFYREAQVLLAQLQGRWGNEPKSKTPKVVEKKPTHMEANFNTGTLAFRGFDVDDDDDEDEDNDADDYTNKKNLEGEGETSVFPEKTTSLVLQGAVVSTVENTQLDPVTAIALGRELEYMQRRLQNTTLTDTPAFHGCSDFVYEVLILTARMLTAFNGHTIIDHVEHPLSCLLKIISRVKDCHAECSEAPLVDVAVRLVTIALRLVLMSVATENADYALANTLLACSTIPDMPYKQKAEKASLATVESYMQIVFDTLSRARAMTVGELQHGKTIEEEGASCSSYYPCIGHNGEHHLQEELERPKQRQQGVHEERLRTLLFVWFSAFLQLGAVSELREEMSRMRAALMGLSCPPPPYAQLLVWLLGCMLCRVTIGFNTVVEHFIHCIVAVRGLDDSFFTNPNGIFVEEEQELCHIAEVLERNLLFAGADADAARGRGKTFEDKNAVSALPLQLITLDLSVAHAEFFWQLPLASVKISSDTDAVVLHLVDATRPHATANLLFCKLRDGATTTLRRMEALWMRRYHTHFSYREWLLEKSLRGNLMQLVTTDRLVLQQSCHAICSVDYDHSSFDSLVWGTEAGTEVSHGYCEILADENGASIRRGQSDQNIESVKISIGVVAGIEAEGAPAATATEIGKGIVVSTVNRKALVQRPRLSIAARAKVASHPHLPFFLIPNSDGCVDMYSFTCAECVATFDCGESYVVTDVSYSPDGYMFAVGLADGSVLSWRFSLGNSAREPLFQRRLLSPGGVKATVFCGNVSSFLIVLGLDHITEGTPARQKGGVKAGETRRQTGRSDSHDFSPAGTILVVDLAIHGRVVTSRKLPFVPEYAVSLRNLDSILCVSVDGQIALYQVLSSRLYILAPKLLTSPRVTVSCVSASHYDDLIALGTEGGQVLLLQFRTILEVAATCAMEPDDIHPGVTGVAEKNVLQKSSRLQLTPTSTSRSGVRCIVFTPSVMLAGLDDGKLVAATLVSNALRQTGPLE